MFLKCRTSNTEMSGLYEDDSPEPKHVLHTTRLQTDSTDKASCKHHVIDLFGRDPPSKQVKAHTVRATTIIVNGLQPEKVASLVPSSLIKTNR